MKELRWIGDALDRLRELPQTAQRGLGYGLHRVQTGQPPVDCKPMPTVGAGAFELRFRDRSGAYRIFYVAKLGDAVYVLHTFTKKTQNTSPGDLTIGRNRYRIAEADARKD
ncbi:type II toxin-antitoxin system RelE/ParE family toxin [Nocardia ignorata]|uniref:type II toxin-antitoxin system RelE/ParE family toxin n=1 Tax=Nocardia ignorata TaxID=145285 RepID=UPI003631E1BC